MPENETDTTHTLTAAASNSVWQRMTLAATGSPWVTYHQTYPVPQPVATTAPAAPVAVVEMPLPTPAPITAPDGSDDELLTQHSALCEKLGIYSAAGSELRTRELVTLLSEMGLRQYDKAQVKAYLDGQYGPPTDHGHGVPLASWGYRPLVKGRRTSSMLGSSFIMNNGHVGVDDLDVYKKAVPLPVLRTVEQIHEKFPTAEFYVSDNITMREVSDPFLLVRFNDVDYIVERWDEPNYRER